MKKQINRPDFSNLLAHFTTGRNPVGNTDKENPVKEIAKGSALKRLISILEQKKIIASTMPWTNCRAVCFTECPWTSLIEHTRNYSSFGIGFSKENIFSADGAPVYYVRADQYTKQTWDKDLHPFVTPFWPEYRPDALRNKTKIKKLVITPTNANGEHHTIFNLSIHKSSL